MEFKEIKLLAWNGITSEQLKSFNCPENCCYQALAYLCQRVKKSDITTEEASVQSDIIQGQYEKFLLSFKSNKATAEMLVAMGDAISKCNKNKSNCECCNTISERWGHSDACNDFIVEIKE